MGLGVDVEVVPAAARTVIVQEALALARRDARLEQGVAPGAVVGLARGPVGVAERLARDPTPVPAGLDLRVSLEAADPGAVVALDEELRLARDQAEDELVLLRRGDGREVPAAAALPRPQRRLDPAQARAPGDGDVEVAVAAPPHRRADGRRCWRRSVGEGRGRDRDRGTDE